MILASTHYYHHINIVNKLFTYGDEIISKFDLKHMTNIKEPEL